MRHIILSLDGLSIDDAIVLQSKLTSFGTLLEKGSLSSWDAGILTCAQPIWAEILTGKPWHENGCSGYAKPSASLNRLSIFTEKNLLVPLELLQHRAKKIRTVTINIPLLMPADGERDWISDGSLPLNKTVSPSQYLSQPQFESYRPRPYADIGRSMESPNKSAESFVDSEVKRLELALELVKNSDWDRFLYRISVFDHLSHLLGMNFLSAKDLQISEAIEGFLQRLDKAISVFANLSNTQLTVMSSYSHVACRGTLNLNVLLEQGGFLRLHDDLKTNRNSPMRLDAMKAIAAEPIASQLASTEGRLIGAQTIAASPVSGCIFINRSSLDDGAVNEQDCEGAKVKVSNFLHEALSKRVGSKYTIEARPHQIIESSPNLGINVGPNRTNNGRQTDVSNAEIPDFMVKVDGIEFKNMQESNAGRSDVPRTTHSSAGFVFMPGRSISEQRVRPTQMCELIC